MTGLTLMVFGAGMLMSLGASIVVDIRVVATGVQMWHRAPELGEER